MIDYLGVIDLNATIRIPALAKNASNTPTDITGSIVYQFFDPDTGSVSLSGSASSFKKSGSVTGATNVNPIVITSVAHGLQTGNRVTISGVGGNTAANTTAQVTRVSADTFSLDGVAGNGAYTSGGTWHISGFYTVDIVLSGANGFASGKSYIALLQWVVSSASYANLVCFSIP